MSRTKEFDTALERLDKDLEELESVSTHLKEVKSFVEDTKELGKKFTEHIHKASQLVEDSTKSLDNFVEENGSKIKDLTDSHQKLAGRVKDMEDKVTVLNTKTEAMSKEIGNQIDQLKNALQGQVEGLEKKHEKHHSLELEKIDLNKRVTLYLGIPVILFLIYVSVILTI
jgi:methyl-accepting chemotaxis protein